MWVNTTFRTLRTYAPYIVFPVAVVVGFIGYRFGSNSTSSKRSPYREPIKESRSDRLTSDESLRGATDVQNLRYANVLDQNLSPSLQ